MHYYYFADREDFAAAAILALRTARIMCVSHPPRIMSEFEHNGGAARSTMDRATNTTLSRARPTCTGVALRAASEADICSPRARTVTRTCCPGRRSTFIPPRRYAMTPRAWARCLCIARVVKQ